jgi:hypothetical protein
LNKYGRLFDTFFQQSSPVNKLRLGKIIIHATHGLWTMFDEMVEALEEYAQRYSHHKNMTLVLRFHYERIFPLETYLSQTRVLGVVTRGASELMWPDDTAYRSALEEWVNDGWAKYMRALPENVRFSFVEEFPEECIAGLLRGKAQAEGEPGTFEEDMAAARKVFEEGI